MSRIRSLMSPYGGVATASAPVPDPFTDAASRDMPTALYEMFDWCQFMWDREPTYKTAMDRVVSYFLTPLSFKASNPRETLGEDEQEKWTDLADNHLNIQGHEHLLGIDRAAYGNGFVSLTSPVRRNCRCPKCHSFWSLRVVANNSIFQWAWREVQPHARCPKCQYQGVWEFYDEDDVRPSTLRIKRWPPQEIHLIHDLYTDDVAYYWKIPEEYKRDIRLGRLFQLERVSKPVLEAIRRGQSIFLFEPDEIFHAKEPTLAGRKNRGWGIPRMIASYRQMWHVAMLQKHNESIAIDSVYPVRMLSPAQAGAGDPINTLANMAEFNSAMRRGLAQRARNPLHWLMFPFPVDYRVAGGDARSLAPRELLDQAYDTLLNGSGVPADFYRGSLTMQVFPVAMRLLQCQWHHLVYDNQRFARWVTEKAASKLSWERVRAIHRPVQHADDAQKQMMLMQLAMGGHVALGEALNTLGLDFKEQLRRLIDEARQQQEEQTRLQTEQETSSLGQAVSMGIPPVQISAAGAQQGGAVGGAPAVAGAPVDPATGAPVQLGPVTQMVQSGTWPQTVDDMVSQASALADALMTVPQTQRTSELRQLEQKDDTLHALVTKELSRRRSAARSQGQAVILQQQYGANAG